MRSITMTAEQTAVYNGPDGAAYELMRELISQAQSLSDDTGETVEIYTADGIVADSRTPQGLVAQETQA